MPNVSVGGSVGPVRVSQTLGPGVGVLSVVLVVAGSLYFSAYLLLLMIPVMLGHFVIWWFFTESDHRWRRESVAYRRCPVCQAPPGWWCVGPEEDVPNVPHRLANVGHGFLIHAARKG